MSLYCTYFKCIDMRGNLWKTFYYFQSGNLPEHYINHPITDTKTFDSFFTNSVSFESEEDNENPAVEKAIEAKDFETCVAIVRYQ